MSNAEITIADIINIDNLQILQDSLGHSIGITTVILDPHGVPLTRPTNLRAFCEKMQKSEHGVEMCLETNALLIKKNLEQRAPSVMVCPISGLRTASVPIFLDDKLLGSWLIGQIRTDHIDYSLIEKTAEKAGFSKEQAKTDIDSLKPVSEKEFNDILNLIETYTKILTDIVHINEKLNTRNMELEVMTQNLENSIQTFKIFIDLTNVSTYIFDFYTEKHLMCNKACKQLLKLYESNDECDKNPHSYFFPELPVEKLVDKDGEPSGSMAWEIYDDRVDRWWKITAQAVHWLDDKLVVVTTVLDISDQKTESQRLAYLAYYNQALNIPNGHKLNEDLKKSAREGTYLICFNIKGLLEINNAYGRENGDALLKCIAGWLKTLLNARYYCINGHSFAIMIENHNESDAMLLAEKLYDRFSQAWTVDLGDIQQDIYADAHMGVIPFFSPAESQDILVDLFEQVVSSSRRKGQLVLFDEEMHEELQQDVKLMVNLKKCVLNQMEAFSLNYQPFVDIKTGKWVGVEALCRWNSRELGPISPDVFIPRAEKSGLIGMMSNWIYENAVSQMKSWKLDKLPHFSLSLNLSALQLKDRALKQKIWALLEKYDYPSNKLKLEITETAEATFDSNTLSLLRSIRQSNVSLALDDFGIGYATFSNIQNIPISVLKIDRSFVTGIGSDLFLQHTMNLLVEYAHSIGLEVLAEGVETKEELLMLKDRGVDLVQGFYYSRPLSKADMEAHLPEFY